MFDQNLPGAESYAGEFVERAVAFSCWARADSLDSKMIVKHDRAIFDDVVVEINHKLIEDICFELRIPPTPREWERRERRL
jgi:hypothetical protein